MLDCVPFEMLCLPAAYAQVAAYVGDDGDVDARGKRVTFDRAALARAGASIEIVLSVPPDPVPASYYTKLRANGSVIYYSRYCQALHCGFELLVVDQSSEAKVDRCGVVAHVVAVDGADDEGLRRALGSIRLRLASGAPESWLTLGSLPQPPKPSEGDVVGSPGDGKDVQSCPNS